jgi:hypothetical protein
LQLNFLKPLKIRDISMILGLIEKYRHQFPKPRRRVRFPYPAPYEIPRNRMASGDFHKFLSTACGGCFKCAPSM